MRTFGTATLKKSTWHVDAEPHVALRLRRLFGKKGGSVGTVKLSNTQEVCRDLLWFTQRYPLVVKPRDLLEANAEAYDARMERFAELLEGRIEPRAFDMALPPRPYQRVAADLALQEGGLLIADDVGLGKTATAIAALTDPSTRPALVVTLTHLPRQWQSELAKFAPTLRTHVLKKGTPYELTKTRWSRGSSQGQLTLLSTADAAGRFPDVLICNYHKLAGWAEALAGKIRCVVFDEVQELRRKGTLAKPSQKYEAAKHIARGCEYRIGLTATPVMNYGIEFFNIMRILCPGALGTKSEFTKEWCSSSFSSDPQKTRINDPKAFGTYVREAGLMIRRTRADVRRELPDLSRSVVHVDADEKALDEVADQVAELARLILSKSGAWQERGQAARDMDWRLRQATGIGKAPHVADFVRLLVESGERVVLYGWHRQVYDIWKDRLKDLKPVLFTGSESPKQKDENKRAFLKGESQVLIMSLRAGAGLDGLQAKCRTVVFGELDWSPGMHEQAIGRVHRDGQPDPVMAYFLVAGSGSDPFVMDVLGIKREQVEGVRDPDAKLLESVKDDAMRKLAEGYLRQRGLPVPTPSPDRQPGVSP